MVIFEHGEKFYRKSDIMRLTVDDLCRLAVISVSDGGCLGYADDLLIETEEREVLAIVIKGRLRLFGLLGRDEDTVIPWEKIEKIGRDAVLVNCKTPERLSGGKNFFEKFFGI